MVATELATPMRHFDPQGHRMGPIGTLAAQTSVVLGLMWTLGALADLILPPTVGLLTLMPVLGALILAPRSVVMQLPISFSVLGLVALPVASIAWTVDGEATLVNIRSFIPAFIAVILAAGVLTLRDFADALLWTMRITIMVTIAALILFPATRAHELGGVNGEPYPGWHGFFYHKNKLTPFLTLGVPTVLVFERNALFKWVTLGLIGILFVGSTSGTGISGGVVAVIAWMWLRVYQNQEDDRDSTLLFSISVIGVLTVIGGAVASFATITSAYGKDTSLSGRTEIWEASLAALSNRPWFGHGFGALFWRVNLSPETAEIWRHVGFEASHAHNGALDLALQIGLVGLAIFTVLWLSIVRHAWARIHTSPELSLWILSVVAANFVIGLTEDVFFGGWVAVFGAMRVLLMRRESALMQPSWRDGMKKWA